jgi:methylenetetrahydrofolate reductase (NADPH)
VRIDDLYRSGDPVYSFEFFPPKSDKAAVDLMVTVRDLRDMLHPDFVSVTYGAGGTTRGRTREIVTRIQGELDITSMAHLTCVGHTPTDLREVVDEWVAGGVENVLALRGDPPKGETEFKPVPGGFAHGSELTTWLREHYDLCVGGACYPESHPESGSRESDLEWTRHKVDCGTSFLITQLFFRNADYFDFVERARAAGIDVPIIPGIMPITNVAQIERFTKMCGAQIPETLHRRLRHYQDDPQTVTAIGIEHAIGQCRELLEQGAPGLHFYTLNKSHITRSILAAVKPV